MINRRFFNFKKYDTFLQHKDEIPEDAIVFIQDRTCIWAHGKEYACGAKDIDVDEELDLTSTNPVQNKAIATALRQVNSSLGTAVRQFNNGIRTKQDVLTAGEGITIEDNVISSNASTTNNMVTLSTSQYEDLVNNNLIQEDMYYFTYETVIWRFGDKFPIILTDGSTPDSIGTFPINLT